MQGITAQLHATDHVLLGVISLWMFNSLARVLLGFHFPL